MVEMTLLKLEGIRKRFGATQALGGVSFDLNAGEIHALMGENGAGKSTLMKILAGNLAADSGKIFVDGQEVHISSPNDARKHGIAIIHQEINTVPNLTVAENLCLGVEPLKHGILDREKMRSDARAKLSAIGVDIDVNRPLGSFSIGMQQMVEIARAAAEDARILVLDEPTAALSRAETEDLFRIIREQQQNGVGLIYITHRMEEVWKLADRVSVLRDGTSVGTQLLAELTPDEIVRMMVGRKIGDLYEHADRASGEVVLEAKDLKAPGVDDVSFKARAGQILGFAGLVGAGRSETVRLLMGADPMSSGTLLLKGERYHPKSPKEALESGIAMVPESRKEQGLFLDHTTASNISIASLGDFTKLGVLARGAIRKKVRQIMEVLNIRKTSTSLPVRALSGGNQQKALLGRTLMAGADLLIFDEPTRGVDIGAKREIYEIMNDLAKEGKTIIMVSSDLPEVLGMSDRIIVMRKGKVVGELDARDATEESVMSLATGATKEQA
ncbi:sugar ABC transporter ATP-binding protein [Actinotignum timonense]|nr:sugar ABC transporter ATP-binding protein [Actinotignum timonense]MDY5130031.1 sugar ABC transporter ATP-binding protein [Actinotignum timonense]MDY5149960.1 sugar ABC transporter ATP-binding protein [Actinotignum timonense]